MLNLSCTSMHRTREIKFVPGTQVKEEGVPLVSILVEGKEAVKVFEGSADLSANAKFVGFSYSETLTPVTANNRVVVTTDASGEVVLPHEPMTGQLSVYQDVAGVRTRVANANVTIDSTNAKKIKVTDGTDPLVSVQLEVTYKYMPTLQQAFWEHRVLIPAISSSAMTDSIGVIFEGDVFTDKIDLASDFENRSNKLFINAEGNVAAAGSVPGTGIEIPNAQVIAAPGSSNGFLGIRF